MPEEVDGDRDNVELSASEERALRRLVHEEVIGTRSRTGPFIALLGTLDWEADTLCGQRVATGRVTRLGARVTCPGCREASDG